MKIDISEKDIQDHILAVKEHFGDKPHRAYVYTFGCQQNEADSEKIRGILKLMSYEITDEYEQSDLIVINTCAVRRLAELKALSMLGNFKELKRQNPELIVGVVGCMAAEEHIIAQLKRSFPYVGFTAEPGMMHKIPELIDGIISRGKRGFVFKTDNRNIIEGVDAVRESKHRAWVSVMHGCNNFCSYCIVPYVRGRERSRSSADVIAECKSLIDSGCREITLLGQNVNSYRDDMDFAALMEAVASQDGDFVLRFMTSHPKDVSDALIDVMRRYHDKIAPHFHLPMQSGSDAVLSAMNRTYNMEKYLSVVKKLRGAIPGIALTSDIIVGFPGESDEDFAATMRALEEIKFDMVYSFNYSPREGTKAAKMEDQVSDEKKNERMRYLLEVQTEISHKINDKYIGTVQKVLVDSKSPRGGENTYKARTMTNKLVHFESDTDQIGEFVYVKIDRVGAFDLFGSKIER